MQNYDSGPLLAIGLVATLSSVAAREAYEREAFFGEQQDLKQNGAKLLTDRPGPSDLLRAYNRRDVNSHYVNVQFYRTLD